MTKKLYLGIDIGGTKTALCVGTADGRILASDRFATDTSISLDDYGRMLGSSGAKVLKAAGIQETDIAAAGISAPGPINVAKGILMSPPNNPGWKDVPISEMARKIFGTQVYLNNDANAAAMAEYLYGEFRGTRNLVYLTCSTGMGGGIIAEGVLLQGASDGAGEIGHHILDPAGPLCGCGMRGCFEAYCGGRNVAEQLKAKLRSGGARSSILDKAGGSIEKIDHRMFAGAVREGDPFAVAEWDKFIERLAQGVGNVIMIFNPSAVILGTIAIHEGDLVMKPLLEKLPRYAWKWHLDVCKVAPSALRGNAGSLGALTVALTGESPGRLPDLVSRAGAR